jgi:hypothetical protein
MIGGDVANSVLLQIMVWSGKVGDHLFDRQGSQGRDIRQPFQVAHFDWRWVAASTIKMTVPYMIGSSTHTALTRAPFLLHTEHPTKRSLHARWW